MKALNYFPSYGKKPFRSILKAFLNLGFISLLFMTPGFLIKRGILPTHFWNSLFMNEFWQIGGDEKGRLLVYFSFILVMGLLIGIGLPRLWASSIAGGMFGVTAGIILSLAASLIGASIVFQAGRLLWSNRPENKLFQALGGFKEILKNKTFLSVLYARLFPFSNSTIVSLYSGACDVNFIQFIGASLVGFLPLTIVFSLVGDGSSKMNWGPILLGFGLMALLCLGTAAFRKFITRDLPA